VKGIGVNKGLLLIALVFVPVVLCSCARDETPEQATTAKGRKETRVVEAVGAVGHDAAKVRKPLDRALDANEKRNAQMQALLDE